GPYKILKDYFTTFSNPNSSVETMRHIAKKIEDFLKNHHHLFFYPKQLIYTKLTTRKGMCINWSKYIKLNRYMISFISPTLRVRLGSACDAWRLDQLSLYEIRNIMQTYAPAFDFCYYNNIGTGGKITNSFLFDEI